MILVRTTQNRQIRLVACGPSSRPIMLIDRSGPKYVGVTWFPEAPCMRGATPHRSRLVHHQYLCDARELGTMYELGEARPVGLGTHRGFVCG